MHKEHPVPNMTATKAPKVDGFITDYLKDSFPKSNDTELMKVQSAILKVCGPMACMWVELIDNDLLSNSDATVNVHDVLSVQLCFWGTRMSYFPSFGAPKFWLLSTHHL